LRFLTVSCAGKAMGFVAGEVGEKETGRFPCTLRVGTGK